MTFWLITVLGDVEPEIRGPFETVHAQINEAKVLRRLGELTDEDGLFWLDIDAYGKPQVGTFDAMTFREDE